MIGGLCTGREWSLELTLCSQDGSAVLVALVAAQTRTRKSVPSAIMLDALEAGLRRVAGRARAIGASVHLPRIGHRTPQFNWYGRYHVVTSMSCCDLIIEYGEEV